MTKKADKPESFLNFNIGEIQPKNKTFIPSGEEASYAPEGASLQEINQRRDELRDYYKRNNQTLINVSGSGAASGTLITAPSLLDFYIDTISINGLGSAAGSGNINIMPEIFQVLIAQLRFGAVVGYNSTEITFNNPIKVPAGTSLLYGVGASVSVWSISISGWLEDKPT